MQNHLATVLFKVRQSGYKIFQTVKPELQNLIAANI